MSSRKRAAWAVVVGTAVIIGVYGSQVEAQLPGGEPEGIAGYQRVAVTTPATTNLNKSITAACPSGKVATGGGYEVSGKNPGAVAVYINRPSGDSAWQVLAKRTVNISKTWALTAYAICATGTGSGTGTGTGTGAGTGTGTGAGTGTGTGTGTGS
jgi:hypothetical protein